MRHFTDRCLGKPTRMKPPGQDSDLVRIDKFAFSSSSFFFFQIKTISKEKTLHFFLPNATPLFYLDPILNRGSTRQKST